MNQLLPSSTRWMVMLFLNTSKLYDYSSGSELDLDYFCKLPEDENPSINTSFFYLRILHNS